jgi:MtN3 and saliva related transmembrane protein
MHIEAWTIIGVVAATFTSFGFVPQVRKMWRRRSARDVSHITLFQMMIGCLLWLAYGLVRRDIIIIIANVVAIAVLVVGVILYYRFREKKAALPDTTADAPAAVKETVADIPNEDK